MRGFVQVNFGKLTPRSEAVRAIQWEEAKCETHFSLRRLRAPRSSTRLFVSAKLRLKWCGHLSAARMQNSNNNLAQWQTFSKTGGSIDGQVAHETVLNFLQ
jgi:hypothetical protein